MNQASGDFYYLNGARNQRQYDEMVDLQSRGVCLLCPQHIARERRNSVVDVKEHWVITQNDHPYAGAKLHLLLLPKEHVRRISELSTLAWMELQETLAYIDRRYHYPDYGFCARVGCMARTGATIAHLHFHIISGDSDDPDHKPVRFKVSSKPRDRPDF